MSIFKDCKGIKREEREKTEKICNKVKVFENAKSKFEIESSEKCVVGESFRILAVPYLSG
jgi:hypothetical protein